MSELGKFIAFQAAIRLLERQGQHQTIVSTYEACLDELEQPVEEMENRVKTIYEPFTDEEISAEISEMVRPEGTSWKGEVEVIYQTIDNLHKSIPTHNGDWYFTGNYPTPGGVKVVNQAFVAHYEKRDGRVYDVWF
jgi:amidophosphoribosyltransferase